jgi:hypothetical protein
MKIAHPSSGGAENVDKWSWAPVTHDYNPNYLGG